MEAAFWGLTCEPETGYSQLVDQTFRLSNVALDPKTDAKSGRVTLSVQAGNNVFVIANLLIGAVEQQSIDLTFSEGEEITFMVSGKATLHLTGNYIFDDAEEDDEQDDDDEDDEDDEDDDEDDEDDDDLEEDDDDEDGQDIFFDDEGNPVDAEGNPIDLSSLLADFEGDEDDEDDEEDDEDDEEAAAEAEAAAELLKGKRKLAAPSKKDKKKAKIYEIDEEEEEEAPKKKQDKKADAKKPEAKKEQPKKEQPKKEESKKEEPTNSKKKTLPNGLTIEDIVEGKGALAKNGKKVSVRYIGKLTNGKTFDSNSSGKPFAFKLGAGQVIKGWDLGVQGMNVGGTRKLTIPAALAYGSRGAPPDIPGGATLVFEVKLLGVN
ncbi:peptidylprolyl isomerase fpr4 [Chytriomyces hyalinus]|nr:peptidylprolyl isomerase fpr4 [Chytriomyces hyalinus]